MLNRRDFLKFVGITAGCLGSGCRSFSEIEAAQSKALPNVIFILADDMSYDSVSHFNSKIGNMKTPNIDRLARQGMYFTDAHSGSAVCTPTRYGLLTGRYCWRTKLKKEVLWTYGQPLIDKDRTTVADLLKTQGYQTACVGKWHLGMAWPDRSGAPVNTHIGPYDKTWGEGKDKIAAAEKIIDFTKPIESGPCDRGFDYYFGVDVPNFPPYTWIENRHVTAIPTIHKPANNEATGPDFGSPGFKKDGWVLADILPGLAGKASEWITRAAKEEKPFFLYMPLTSPHSPIAPSKNFIGKSGISTYADFVLETDWAVGQVIATLQSTGQADNTLVIFSTDNGTAGIADFKQLESKGVDLHNHFRGHKTQIYEGGHRVPFIVRWPQTVEAGTVNDQTICLNDFMATMAELTGYSLRPNEAEDSTSILPLITQTNSTLPDHPHVVSHSYGGQFCVRDKDWKLILPRKKGGKYVLYDLRNDTKETHDVANQHPDIVHKMKALLKSYVDRGRSTPGPTQQNYMAKTTWEGLPW
jgi:arylsulfatase A